MTDVLFIALRQFWSRRVFFGTQALPKNRETYVDDQNWQLTRPSGLTGLGAVAGLARLTGLTGGSDRSDRSKQSPSTTRDFYRFKSCNRISCGINPSHPINIKGQGIESIKSIQLLSFYFLLL